MREGYRERHPYAQDLCQSFPCILSSESLSSQCGRYDCCHFADERAEAQRVQAICPRLHGWQVMGAELQAASPGGEPVSFLERTFPSILKVQSLNVSRHPPRPLRKKALLRNPHQPLLRGVRGSILKDCISKIRIPAISQGLTGTFQRRAVRVSVLNTHDIHMWSIYHVLLPSFTQASTQKLPPQRDPLCEALHHTASPALLQCSSQPLSPAAILLGYKYMFIQLVLCGFLLLACKLQEGNFLCLGFFPTVMSPGLEPCLVFIGGSTDNRVCE